MQYIHFKIFKIEYILAILWLEGPLVAIGPEWFSMVFSPEYSRIFLGDPRYSQVFLWVSVGSQEKKLIGLRYRTPMLTYI
jgi:hypothetical protein